MQAVLKGSIVLAVAVALVSILIAATGLHTNVIVSGTLSVVVFIAFNIGVIIWVLRKTAPENGYMMQLVNGLMVGVIAGALIFVFSWLTLSVIFPDYLDEMTQGYIEWMQASGMPEEVMEQQIARMEATTPVSQSIAGTIGTVITSLIIGAITAIFVRKK